MLQKTINQLVSENNDLASRLYQIGIPFYNYSEATLEQACEKSGLDVNKVVKQLEDAYNIKSKEELRLLDYPIDLIVEYLKHTHYLFIKRDLPFINRLISHASSKNEEQQTILNDLKEVFPLFLEDFVQHIYEEEDSLFSYIQKLAQFKKGKINSGELFLAMDKTSIQKFALEHHQQDDEMHGIKKITANYTPLFNEELEIKVLYNELKNFEERLKVHAGVENNILFPKAMQLESELMILYHEQAKSN